MTEASKQNQTSDDRDNEVSTHTTPSQDHESEVDGGLSITSNIRKLIEGSFC